MLRKGYSCRITRITLPRRPAEALCFRKTEIPEKEGVKAIRCRESGLKAYPCQESDSDLTRCPMVLLHQYSSPGGIGAWCTFSHSSNVNVCSGVDGSNPIAWLPTAERLWAAAVVLVPEQGGSLHRRRVLCLEHGTLKWLLGPPDETRPASADGGSGRPPLRELPSYWPPECSHRHRSRTSR